MDNARVERLKQDIVDALTPEQVELAKTKLAALAELDD